jgi:hypothetical protein
LNEEEIVKLKERKRKEGRKGETIKESIFRGMSVIQHC